MKNKKLLIIWSMTMVLILTKMLLLQYAKANPAMIEKYYSRGIYPYISGVLTCMTNIFPFSIGEILIFLLIIVAFACLIIIIYRLFKKRRRSAFVLFTKSILIVSFIALLLDLAWLLNNYRPDFTQMSGLKVENISNEELVQTFEALVIKTNEMRAKLDDYQKQENARTTKNDILKNAYKGYIQLNQLYPFISDSKVIAKGLLISPLETKSGYSGIYLFWAGEPTVNIEAPIFTLPHTACHEIAHQKGFAHEEEANYIGFLACKNNDSILFKYSGYFAAMEYVGNALYLQHPERYKELSSLNSEEVRKDLITEYDFWNSQVNETASKVADSANESYLKSYNQPEGIKSYGIFVDLLVADYLEDGEI